MATAKESRVLPEIDMAHLPQHIAIIMDGNGRWAKRRGLPRTAGHISGTKTFRTIAKYCQSIGIRYLTVYAFSTENWKRPQEEVDTIMRLLGEKLEELIASMVEDKVRVKFFGDVSVLSPRLRALIDRTAELSRSIVDGCQVNICVNYGGRAEIVRAAQRWAEMVKSGTENELDEAGFGALLYSADIPDPDLLIRPGGEQRLSNFLPWQTAYTELYFTDVLWPDFDRSELHRAIAAYQQRNRRYGGL
ncbi:MAG: di-trans,poly-cis-decaprenylcistransferase [Oscillospiraceae bacterium]|nr:di-trans,poly-cis-decaprenylcistransferase [Oscillospiraceae bacterium]MCD7767399.1 di-trans,poly-cis-decaprenylcistransferase [Oscillospiraceae bacterium]MCD7853734.1 di-trans,poly-cis-decaprenylcistransferase [Oscillospiraceae bacterium]